MDFIRETLQPHFNFWIYVILMMIGLWAVIAKNNLIKKLIGLSIFQTAIILLYVSLGVKEGATIPILDPHAEEHETVELAEDAEHGHEVAPANGEHHAEDDHHSGADAFANPLPHVLMLTAIVVGVATLGVALSIAQMVFKEFGTLEENEVLEKLKAGNADD